MVQADESFAGEIQVTDVHEIVWNTTALDKLVLGDDEKSLLTAMVASKVTPQQSTFDDFIEGKGPLSCHSKVPRL